MIDGFKEALPCRCGGHGVIKQHPGNEVMVAHVNVMCRLCYFTVKREDRTMKFGINPDGETFEELYDKVVSEWNRQSKERR